MSLEVTLSSGDVYLLLADAANTLAHVEEKVLPGFSIDMTSGQRSIRRMRRIAERSGARVIPGHDMDLWTTLRHAPEHYA
jgi:glyoxylase-like metal-dependent hydrolase (beta-lactamase superfamily II)